MGLIIGLMGPRVLGFLADSKAKTARIQVENLSSAIDLFYLDNGRYPTRSEGLVALVERPNDTPSWNGPYLKGNKVPSDPWGRGYVYRIPGQQGPYDVLIAVTDAAVSGNNGSGKVEASIIQ